MTSTSTTAAQRALLAAYRILLERDRALVAAGVLPPPGQGMTERQLALLAECEQVRRRRLEAGK